VSHRIGCWGEALVCPVFEARRKAGRSKRQVISSGNSFRLFITLFQLMFLKPPDFLVSAVGNGSQRKDFRPVDLMLTCDVPGAVGARQFQHLIGSTQPVPRRYVAKFNSLQEFTQCKKGSVITIDTGKPFWHFCSMPRKLRVQYPGAI
jgi:hypothetical protein